MVTIEAQLAPIEAADTGSEVMPLSAHSTADVCVCASKCASFYPRLSEYGNADSSVLFENNCCFMFERGTFLEFEDIRDDDE